jgi:hypothetical protein
MQMLNLINNRGRNSRGIRFQNEVAQRMEGQFKFVVVDEFVKQIEKGVISFTYQP